MAATGLALTLAPGAWVTAAKRLAMFFSILGGWLWLGERHALGRHLLAAAIAAAGIGLLLAAS